MKAAYRVACAVAIAVCFVCAMSAQSPSTPNSATVKPLVLYDDFNGKRIDPTKWDDSMQSGEMREVVRELSPPYQGQGNNRRLHMYHQTYSWRGNDNGGEAGWIGLRFMNPSSIVETSFSIASNGATVSGCTSNPSTSSSVWAGFVGRFFNYGTQQDGAQDVEADIALNRDSTNPNAPMTVDIHYTTGDGMYSNYQTAGVVSLGETVKFHIKWDQPNHQFIFQVNNNPPVSMPYNIPDTSPPASPIKEFWVGQSTPHCTATPTGSAMMDVYFDNVYVNAQ